MELEKQLGRHSEEEESLKQILEQISNFHQEEEHAVELQFGDQPQDSIAPNARGQK